MAPKKTTRVTKAAPKRKPAPIRKTTVLKRAAPGPAVTVVLSRENNHVTAGSLAAAMSAIHPETPVEFTDKHFSGLSEANTSILSSMASPDYDNPVKAGGIIDLLMRHSELVEQLFDAISEHRQKIEPVMATPPPTEAGEKGATSPGIESDVGCRVHTQSERLAIAIDCLRKMTTRVQL